MGAQIVKIAVFLAGSLALATPDVRAFTITEWGLSTGVRRYTPYTADWDHWTTVVNPLNLTQTALLGDSQSHNTFGFAWGETFGTFLVQSEQEAVGLSGSEVGTISAGFIRVTTLEALPIHIAASWTYGLPADWMMTQFGVAVSGEGSRYGSVLSELHRANDALAAFGG